MSKRATEGREGRAEPEYLGEASLSYLTRKSTEARSRATRERIRSRVGKRHRYHPPPGSKELAGRFYQLLSGHAATGEYLVRLARPRTTDAGGVVATRDRRDTAWSSSADAGRRRFEGCG